MHIFNLDEIPTTNLKGRTLRNAVGANAYSPSRKMTVTYAKYSHASGPMDPHQHAEETVYIMKSVKGYFAYGDAANNLTHEIPLHPGMVLHVGEGEWHVFKYVDDGEIEALCIYGQVDNLRPENK